MTKAKGVWLRPTELREIAEAAVVAEGSRPQVLPSSRKTPSASVKERRGVRPLLAVALGACCCALAAMVSLHVFFAQAIPLLPFGQDAAVSAGADQTAVAGATMPSGHAVRIVADGQEYFTNCQDQTVAGALHQVGVELASLDTVSLPLDMPIKTETTIAVSRGAYGYEKSQPEQEVKPTPPAAPARALSAETPVVASRSGNSADTGQITVAGTTYSYARKLFMESTAYCWTGNKTATGAWPVVGTIAVDPNVIPLGSQVYVEGYGLAVASDTGGVIKGNIIDVYLDTYDQCIKWGRKHGVAVYILE